MSIAYPLSQTIAGSITYGLDATGSEYDAGGTPDTTPPDQVTGLAVADPETGGKLNLTWDAATDDVGVSHYRIYRSTTMGSGHVAIASSITTSYSNTGLLDGTTYYYKVSAVDLSNNEGDQSDEASGTPTAGAALAAAQRASLINYDLPFGRLLPYPDGSDLDTEEQRRQNLYLFAKDYA